MTTDPIADMLTRIRNAVANEAPVVDIPHSRIKQELAKVLVAEGYIVQFEVVEEKPRGILRIQLKYGLEGEKVIQSIRRVSKPGCRVYKKSGDLAPVLDGLGVAILSTSQGVMSDRQARVKKVGGEVLCEIY